MLEKKIDMEAARNDIRFLVGLESAKSEIPRLMQELRTAIEVVEVDDNPHCTDFQLALDYNYERYWYRARRIAGTPAGIFLVRDGRRRKYDNPDTELCIKYLSQSDWAQIENSEHFESEWAPMFQNECRYRRWDKYPELELKLGSDLKLHYTLHANEMDIIRAYKTWVIEEPHAKPFAVSVSPVYKLAMYIHNGCKFARELRHGIGDGIVNSTDDVEWDDAPTYRACEADGWVPGNIDILLAYAILVTCDRRYIEQYERAIKAMRGDVRGSECVARAEQARILGESAYVWADHPYNTAADNYSAEPDYDDLEDMEPTRSYPTIEQLDDDLIDGLLQCNGKRWWDNSAPAAFWTLWKDYESGDWRISIAPSEDDDADEICTDPLDAEDVHKALSTYPKPNPAYVWRWGCGDPVEWLDEK
jgi:hypothetical protein